MSISAFQQTTGESPYFEKTVTMFAFVAQYLAIFGVAVLACFAFRWWVFLVVPVAIIVWFYNMSMSTMGGASIRLHNIALIVALAIHFLKVLPNPKTSGFIAVYIFSLWCSRFLYHAATHFLRAFVLRNPRALEAFGEAITLREAGNEC
jgi:hypothetical protein